MNANTRTAHDRPPIDERPASSGSPTADSAAPAEPLYERVDLDRYAVLHDGPVGYVEHVSPVFVCYVGHPYPRAVEVAQTLDFHEAVKTVLHRAVSARRAQ